MVSILSAAKASSIASSSATVSTTPATLSAAKASSIASSSATRLDDCVDPIRGDRLFGGLLGRQLVDDLVDLGGSELLADLGEGGGERVVDPTLGLLDRVRHRVAALGSRTPFLARRAGCGRDARGAGLDDRAGPAAPRPA